jgi:hypothetical protein
MYKWARLWQEYGTSLPEPRVRPLSINGQDFGRSMVLYYLNLGSLLLVCLSHYLNLAYDLPSPSHRPQPGSLLLVCLSHYLNLACDLLVIGLSQDLYFLFAYHIT